MVPRKYFVLLATATIGLLVALIVVLSADSSRSESEASDPQWLFALTATEGSLKTNEDETFTLSLHESDGARAVAFTDRPDRLVTHLPISSLVSEWNAWFADDPPNAALVTQDDQGRIRTMVLELSDPRVVDDVLTFAARELDPDEVDFYAGDGSTAQPGDSAAFEFTQASLFIDQIHCTGWLPGSGHCFEDGTDPPSTTTPSRYCWGGWFGDLYCSDGTGRNDTPAGTTTDSG